MSQNWKKPVKFNWIWRLVCFEYLFQLNRLHTVFFYFNGIVYHLPWGHTVNKKYYLTVCMKQSKGNARIYDKTTRGNWNIIIHPLTIYCLFTNFWNKNNTVMMCQPPYLQDMALCIFFLSLKVNKNMKGLCFANTDETKAESQELYTKLCFRSASKYGKCAGTSVLYLMWIILKGTKLILRKNKYFL